jgi:hypothetical protein
MPALTRQKKITLGEMPAPSADLLPGLSIGVIFALPTASKRHFISVEVHRAALGGGDVRDVHYAVF